MRICRRCFISPGGFISYGKRKIRIPAGIYPCIRRLCGRTWKCVEVSLYVRTVRRCCIYCDLSGIFSDSGLSDHRLRICSRQRQPEKLCHFLPQVRAKGPALALQRLYRNGRLLPTDDVLHHGNRLDAVLLFPLSDRLPDKSVYDNRAGFLLL